MTHALQNLAFQSHQLRVEQDEQGNPWFCAKDVCDILGYANHNKSIKDHCKSKGVTNRYPVETAGGVQYPVFINEGNLYRLIVRSHKSEAEAFESWVCDEVLPSIRKTGGYMPAQTQSLITAQANYIQLANEHIQVLTENNALRAKIADYQNRTPGIMRAWQDDEVEHLKVSLVNGLGPTSIGIELGRSADSVRHKIALLKKRGELPA